jgi:hypothetical protein
MTEHENKQLASLEYYFSGLKEAIDQGNETSCIFFISKILETQDHKIKTNRIIILLFTFLNVTFFIANAYILFLK